MNTLFIIEHHYYASSVIRNGLGTFTCSDTLNPEEILELEKNATYIHPYQLPTNPTEDEIKELSPINFSYYRLNSTGKYVLMRSNYTGRTNHTPDRFGNFLSHSVIINEPLINLKIPHLFNCINHRKSLTIEEEADFQINANTLEINISEKDVFEWIRHSRLFLLEKKERFNAFCYIIDLLVDGWLDGNATKITICASKEETRNLIFSLYNLLPTVLINKYSFAVYVISPERYPFQITGVIPECGITSLDDKYFRFVKLSDFSEYEPQNEFTKNIMEIISLTVSPFNRLEEFNAFLIKHKINSFDKRLYNVSKIFLFLSRIETESIDSLMGIITRGISDSLKEEIIESIISKNPVLFKEYIYVQFKRGLENKYQYENKVAFFFEFYKKTLKYNSDYFEKSFYDFFIFVKSLLPVSERSKFSFDILISDLFSKVFSVHEIVEQCYFIDHLFKDKRNLPSNTEKLFELYDGIIDYRFKFLNSILTKNKIDALIKTKTFIDSNLQYKDYLINLDKDEKIDVFTKVLLSENVVNKFNLSFEPYISLIKTYLGNEAIEFWLHFFSIDQGSDKNMHSVSFLKRQFVISVINTDEYDRVISSFDYTNYETLWLLESFKESARDFEYEKISSLFKKKSSVEKKFLRDLFRRRRE